MISLADYLYLDALYHIDFWYRRGERDICLTAPVFRAYADGIQPVDRYITTPLPPPDKYGRVYLAYKAARVYTT